MGAPEGKGAFYPQITLPGDLTISQTPAILDVLGESFGLNGTTPEQKMLSKQYVLDLNDVFGEAQKKRLTEDAERRDKWFTLLESRLEKDFFLGDEPTVVDFFGVFAFEWVVARECPFDKFEKLTAWWARIKEVPAVKVLYDSPVKMIPS